MIVFTTESFISTAKPKIIMTMRVLSICLISVNTGLPFLAETRYMESPVEYHYFFVRISNRKISDLHRVFRRCSEIIRFELFTEFEERTD